MTVALRFSIDQNIVLMICTVDCNTARKGLGYDMDYPYDTDLCQAFKKWLCEGKSFSGIDVAEDLKAKEVSERKFKPIEYEKVE